MKVEDLETLGEDTLNDQRQPQTRRGQRDGRRASPRKIPWVPEVLKVLGTAEHKGPQSLEAGVLAARRPRAGIPTLYARGRGRGSSRRRPAHSQGSVRDDSSAQGDPREARAPSCATLSGGARSGCGKIDATHFRADFVNGP